MTNHKEVLRLKSLGLNNSQIATSCGISRTTVIEVLRRAGEAGVSWQTASEMSDKELSHELMGMGTRKTAYKKPDYDYMHSEMAKSGVTLNLLWYEYCDKCRESGEIPYQQTQFKKHYRDYLLTTKATMHINRKPGELMEVDWAGQTSELTDRDTGEKVRANVFVAALPYSGYAYVEAFLSQNQESWIEAHVNAYTFFGGVTRILVPDNLKTGVTKVTKTETILNRTYQEMAEHYGTAIIPARVKAPKDKPTVEGSVGNISTWILAAIRNQQFLSLRELNDVIREKLDVFNTRPFQKKDGSRKGLFENERLFLMPLPAKPYELSEWKTAKVQFNYHISADKQNYSVPYEYIKHDVDVRLTKNIVEVFFEGTRICSHVRLHGRRWQYATLPSHMPPDHQQYAKWDGDRFRKWAACIGLNTVAVVNFILTNQKVEQQGYKACMALLKLTDKHFEDQLEAACEMVLNLTPRPSFKSVKAILESGKLSIQAEENDSHKEAGKFGFTRGADYYRKNDASEASGDNERGGIQC